MSLGTFMLHDYSRSDTDFPGSLSHIKGGGILSPNQKSKKHKGLTHIRNKQFSEGNPSGHIREEPEMEDQC